MLFYVRVCMLACICCAPLFVYRISDFDDVTITSCDDGGLT